MYLSPQALQAFQQHALADYPREACGLVVDGEYVAVPNTAADPTSTFRIAPEDYLSASAGGRVEAVLHSHPYDKFRSPKWPAEWPSTMDMTGWMQGTVPWGICSTDGEGTSPMVWLDSSYTAPLIGREFVHGVHDCYSLIRDWFKLNRQVVIPNFARGIEWWYDGRDLYEDNFAAAGFEEIPMHLASVGDCVMMRVASPVTNHAAVITGNNQILHHMMHRLSGTDRLDRWEKFIVRAVRYKGEQQC